MPGSEVVWKGPRAYLNYCSMLVQRRMGLKKVWGYPFLLTIDPSSACHLHCLFCPHGSSEHAHRSSDFLTLDLFQKIIDEVGPYVFRLEFFNWGEPLLNKHFLEMVRYAKRHRIWVFTSSNLSLELSDEQIDGLVRSGLDSLIVSLDGVNEEQYLKYRIGGKFDLVVRNMRRIVAKRRELGLNHPTVVWQFLVFRHNEPDIETAKQMAAEMGVVLKLGAPYVKQEGHWRDMTPTLNEYNLYRQQPSVEAKPEHLSRPKRCDWLYASAAINANGSLSPCCAIWDENDDFGYLQGGDFHKLYNNGKYQAARAFFTKSSSGAVDIICRRCPVPSQQSMMSGIPVLPIKNPLLCRVLRIIKTLIEGAR